MFHSGELSFVTVVFCIQNSIFMFYFRLLMELNTADPNLMKFSKERKWVLFRAF